MYTYIKSLFYTFNYYNVIYQVYLNQNKGVQLINTLLYTRRGEEENGRVNIMALLMNWGNETEVQAYQCSQQ